MTYDIKLSLESKLSPEEVFFLLARLISWVNREDKNDIKFICDIGVEERAIARA